MPRPPLTRTRIVTVGVSIVNEMGFSALSLRAVSRRVNATTIMVQRTMGATELVQAVAAQILTSMPDMPVRGPWIRRLRSWAGACRLWLIEYPGIGSHLLANRWQDEVALDRLEDVVRVLHEAGVAPDASVQAGRALYWYILSATELDRSTRMILGGDHSGETLAGSANRWPLQASHHGGYTERAALAQFEAGLNLLLAGVEHQMARRVVRAAEQLVATNR